MQYLENKKDEMIETLRRLLKYDSVMGEPTNGAPNGKVVGDCLNEAIKIAKELGFKTGIVDGYAGYAETGEGDDYVAVLGHLDIVPAGNDWTYDPFGGEVHDGKIYGRGTNDDKGPLVAALYGVKALMDENVELGSRVRIIFGTSEETGGPDIEKYLLREPQPKAGFTPDAGFPVINGEKGIINVKLERKINTGNIEFVEIMGGKASNMVPDRAYALYRKDGIDTRIEEKGLSAHGSTPEKGENAILKLFKILGELNEELNKEMTLLIDSLSDTTGKGLGLDLQDEPSGKLSMNFGVCDFKDGVLSMTLNFRVPVTFSEEDLIRPIEKFARENGFEVKKGTFTEPLYYPKDKELVKILMEVYREYTGDKNAEPIAIGGGTYAKTMNNIVAFGPGLPGRKDVDHIADEHIYIEDFLLWAKIYKEAVRRLTFTQGE